MISDDTRVLSESLRTYGPSVTLHSHETANLANPETMATAIVEIESARLSQMAALFDTADDWSIALWFVIRREMIYWTVRRVIIRYSPADDFQTHEIISNRHESIPMPSHLCDDFVKAMNSWSLERKLSHVERHGFSSFPHFENSLSHLEDALAAGQLE